MPLPFRDVYDRWERSKSFGDPRDLSTFSAELNETTGTDDFAAGIDAGWWTRASTAADKYFFEPFARESGLEYAGRKIGGLFGERGAEIGAEVARGTPRMVAQTVPLIAAELLSGGAATPVVAGALATGGLFGAQTYAETQSPKAAVLSGATAAALPAVGRIGGNVALRTIGPPVERVVSEGGVSALLPKVAADTARYKATKLLGSQAAQISALQGSQAGQAAITGTPYNPYAPEFWAQQIPFTLLDIGTTTLRKVPTAKQVEPRPQPMKEGVANVYVPPESTPEARANAEALLDKISALARDSSATPEQKTAAFAEGFAAVQNPKLATQQKPVGETITLTGRFKRMENGNLKMYVGNAEGIELPEHSNVFVNTSRMKPGEYSVQLNKEERTATLKVPRRFVNTTVDYPLTDKDFPGVAQIGQEALKPTAPVEGVTVPEDNLLSLRQKAEKTIGNKTAFEAVLGKEPKDEAKAIPYWQRVIKKMTPEHLRPEYVSPFDIPSGRLTPDEVVAVEKESGASIPTMVTNQMIADLKKRGYSHTAAMKMPPEEAHTILTRPDPLVEVGPPLGQQIKSTVQNLEQASVDTSEAKQKIDKVPAGPQDVADTLDLDDVSKPVITKRLDEHAKTGLTPTQAVEKVRLQTQAPVVDKAKQAQKIERERLETIAWSEGKAPTITKNDKGQPFRKPWEAEEYLEEWKAKHPEIVREFRVMKLGKRGRWVLRAQPLEVPLEKQFKPPAAPVEGEAPVPKEETAVTGAGAFVRTVERRGRLTEDVPEYEEGIEVERPSTGHEQRVDPSKMPEVSYTELVKQLDLASNAPSRVMNAGGFDDMVETLTAIRQFRVALGEMREGRTSFTDINKAIKDAKILPFESESEMRGTFKMVRDGLRDFTNKTRSFSLDSEVPHDPALVQEIGIQGENGLANFLDWYVANQPDGALRELAAGLRKFSSFDHIDVTYEPKGSWYDRAEQTGTGRPRINLGFLPASREDAVGRWGAQTVLQEIAHDTTAQLYNRTDPAAVSFKADMARILDVVSVSNLVPKEVRRVLNKSIKEDWYGEWSRGGLRAPVPQPVMNVAGRKGTLLKNGQVNEVVEGFVKGKNITDAFGGSGQLSHFAKGAGAKSVTMNVKDPQMRAMFEDMKSDPESFAARVEQAVQPIKSNRYLSTPTLEDGSPVTPYLDTLARTDPNVALFIKQNLNAQGREVTTSAFTPTKVISSVGLRDLPNRVRAFAGALDNVSGVDGWDIVRGAKGGDNVLVDPPYVGQGGQYETGPVTVEQQLANYEKHLFPAAKRGAKFTVFDMAEPRLMQALLDNGFNVAEVQRANRGGVTTLPEFIATNHEKPTGKLRAYTADAVEPAVDLYERYNRELPGRESWYSTFYNLQNGHELIGGIFGDPVFIKLLQDVKMPRTQSPVLNFFANVWARMFGYSTNAENAFARLISSYDNFLSGTRMSKGYNGMSYVRDMLLAEGVKPEALASRMDTISNVYSQGGLRPSIEGFEREMKDGLLPATTVAGELNPALRDAVVAGDAKAVGDATMNLLADQLPQHQELWARMKEDLHIAKQLYGEAKKGNVPAELSLFQEGLNAEAVKLNAMKRALDKQALAVERWNTMDSLTNSDGIRRVWSGTLKGAKVPGPSDPTGNEDIARQALGIEPKGAEYITSERRRIAVTGEKPQGFLDRNFKFASFTSEEQPGFKPIYNTMLDAQADAHRRMAELEVVRNSDPRVKGWSKEVANANKRVAETPGLNRIISDMLRRAQVLEKMKEPVTLDDPEMQVALRRASDAKRRNGRSDRDDIITTFNSESARAQHRVDQVIPQHFNVVNRSLTALTIIGREIGMPAERAFELANQTHGALEMLRDPTTAAQGSEMLRAVATGMKPDTFTKVLEQATGFIKDSERHMNLLKQFRHYVSEQRFGKFHLVMSREGVPYREGFMTEKEARARAKELQPDGWVLEDIVPKEQANVAGYLKAEDPIIASQRELDQQTLNRLESVISDLPLEKQAELRPLVQRAAEYESSAAAFSPIPTQASPRRRFVAGRETIDMLANASEETKRFVNWMRHRESRIKTSVYMLDPKMLSNRALKQYATQFVDNQLAADSPIGRRASEAAFYWYLAGNFGNDILESMQTMTTGMASVIAETGSVKDALKYVTGASGKVLRRYTTGKWGDKSTEWFINWLSSRGSLGLPTWGDVFDPTTQNFFDVTGPKSSVGKVFGYAKHALRGYKALFLRHNDMVGGLAGFQLGRDLGMGLEEAARFAEGVKNRGLYSAGKVQRPVGLYSIKEKAVPQLMGSLKTYVLGWFSQLSHNWKVGFAGAPGDYSPTQRRGAKAAFMYMLGSQATLAGALGLPGVGQALALLKQGTGLDLKAWTRQNLAKMFGEDQEDYGGFMTGLALHGLTTQLSPFDISGRQVADVPFTGVSSWKGFDMSNIVPVPFSMTADFIGGVMNLAKGKDPSKAFPIALRGPVQLIHGGGDIRNSRGELLYQLSPTERFWKSLGLEPTRVAAAKETAATVESMNKAAAARRQNEASQVALLLQKGDRAGASRHLAEIARKNPTYDMASFVRSVSTEVERRTFPYDWKREVNPAVDIAGLSSPWPSQELERRQFRRGVESQLGLAPPMNPVRGDIRAATMDQLINSNPYMTRAQALRSLLEAQPARRRSALSLPEVYQ